MEILSIISLLAIGVSYYFIFKEHHKRNKMKLNEIFPLIIEYAVMCIMSMFLLILGLMAVKEGYVNNDEISEVIKELTFGLTIISIVIIHFIFWVKKHLVDLDNDERKAKEERTNNIAEWIELIGLILLIIASIFNIIKYIQFLDVVEKYRQIGISIACIIGSIILLITMNPLDIKGKLIKK